MHRASLLFVESSLLLDGERTSSESGPAMCISRTNHGNIVSHHTGSSPQAAINAWYGLLKDEVEIPLRSSKTFVADMMIVSFGKPQGSSQK